MNEQESSAIAYRIKQLENNIKRAESSAAESLVHLEAVLGTLKVTKHDFENLREMIKQ